MEDRGKTEGRQSEGRQSVGRQREYSQRKTFKWNENSRTMSMKAFLQTPFYIEIIRKQMNA
jgi:hypothetical protein